MMWVAHIFDDRPISKVVDMSHEYRDGRNYYRAKVESDPSEPRFILTVWGVGYKFTEGDGDAKAEPERPEEAGEAGSGAGR